MASALSVWARFCEQASAPHFPVTAERAVSFAGIFRDPGTYRAYLSHVRSACEFLGFPVEWASSPKVTRAKCGLLKQALVHKGPRLAVDGNMISRIAGVQGNWAPVRFFCIFSWVFMLRASSEAAGIAYMPDSPLLHNLFLSLPEDRQGVVGLVGDTLVLRLRSRKTHLFGDCVKRMCSCETGDGVAAHVPSELCPVHVLAAWLQKNVSPGGSVFGPRIVTDATAWLRVALAARDVPHAERYGLHSLRRGTAQALVAAGWSLPTLLRAGGWKSSAFKVYLDMVGVEDHVLRDSLNTLVDLDN